MLKIGTSVIYNQPESEIPVNGHRDHAAVVTRVWKGEVVNLTVFFDGGHVEHRGSVRYGHKTVTENGSWSPITSWLKASELKPARAPATEARPDGG